LATPLEVDNLSRKAAGSDFVAIEAGYAGIELADCLVAQFKETGTGVQIRVAKSRPTNITTKNLLSTEMKLAKITAAFCCSTLFQRMMNNPRALASLNCFLAINRGHFSWIDETSSGHKKPPLFPFPANLSGRDLLLLFHQFIMLINGIDVVFGISLSLLYKTADEILFLGHPPLLVAKYIDDIRQHVFSTENVCLMWSFQDSIFTQSLNSLVVPVVVPDPLDTTPRRRARGRGRSFGQQGNQSDLPVDMGQTRLPSLRLNNSDPNRKWWACNDFNDRGGCGFPASLCKYNHICSACADPNHGLSTHAKSVPNGTAGDFQNK
jgi:hypothetical protein